ncbi:PE-PPE domain-containing protein [Mycobacterium sp. TNTM28]|uniref:PE-PPE domain-containing protein n=1 Tax=[Mycobacterium] fortunisiensis TaxID=2600579 RepID=A0ABS6KL87_9MYCO|nr:PE-PPE domain-containing protein [[Mycobacterium] fortunisiensis]MBU9764343.1 PE-PPE domain-containing protein [[Mycobacterium] fortunisiensis]
MRSGWALVAAAAASCTVAAVTATQLWVVPSNRSAELLAKTILAMGGNGNGTGLLMQNELDGYINPGDANYGLCATGADCTGDQFQIATWNATAWTPASDFDRQQADGVDSLDRQLRQALAAEKAKEDGDEPDGEARVVVVGYSSSADVVLKEIQALQAQLDAGDSNALKPDEVSFLVMGNPNRPNGGILARFPAFTLPIAGVTFGGSSPHTDYQITDISWEYDLASDAPAYLNPLSFANGVLGFFYQHSFYFGLDPNTTDTDSVVFDGYDDNGNRYITISARHLALLQPLYDIGVPIRILDAVEPTLKVLIDLGYDRDTKPWETKRLALAPPPAQVAAAMPELQKALTEGAQIALGLKEPPSADDPDTENATLAVIENVLGGFLKEGSWDTVKTTIENTFGISLPDLPGAPEGQAGAPAEATRGAVAPTPQADDAGAPAELPTARRVAVQDEARPTRAQVVRGTDHRHSNPVGRKGERTVVAGVDAMTEASDRRPGRSSAHSAHKVATRSRVGTKFGPAKDQTAKDQTAKNKATSHKAARSKAAASTD